MGHELDDFCRRGVFKEEEGQYWPTVELFGRWLRDGGFARLVDGHLGDELEEKRRLWNRIPDNVRRQIVELALDEPELSPRELAVTFTDTRGYFVSCRVRR